jgi:hypothetical protein
VNPQDLPHKLAQRLDEGLDSLPPSVAFRLRAAREAALARARRDESVIGRSSIGVLVGGAGRNPGRRMLAPAIALVLALLGMLYWQQAQRLQHAGNESSDIDSEVLTEELPVNAYLDEGFEVWLYHSTPASEQQ